MLLSQPPPRPAQGFFYHLQHQQLLLRVPALLILHRVPLPVPLVALVERSRQVGRLLAESFAPTAIFMGLLVMTVSAGRGLTYLCIAGNVTDEHTATQ